MRIFLVAFGCMIVAGLVVFLTLGPAEPTQTGVNSPRLNLSAAPRPIPDGDGNPQRILEFFPDEDQMRQLANVQPARVVPTGQQGSFDPSTPDESMDVNRLLSIIDDWVYVQYFQIGNKKKGRIHQSRADEMMEVTEGEQLENGITIQNLSDNVLTLRLGEALFHMRLSREPEFFADLKANPRPLTQAEQRRAYEYYMARYGDKFQMYSRQYKTPLQTMNTPERVTPQQQQQARQQYMQQYGNQFAQERSSFPSQIPYTEEQQENFRQYWLKNHPDKPMPNFEDIYSRNALGPAERIQSDRN